MDRDEEHAGYSGLAAELYDQLRGQSPLRNEFEFYRQWLQCHPGPALEVSCGTGRILLSLTLADLCGVGERIFHALPDMARDFYTVPARPGHERNLMRPYFAAHGGDSVAEGENSFWIPSGGSRLELS